jgi:chromosome segregation ATPase
LVREINNENESFNKMNANMEAIKLFKQRYEKYRSQKISEEKALKDEAKTTQKLNCLKLARRNEFESAFHFISRSLKTTYQS